MTTNLFEYATQHKLRFPSPAGQLTAEQLWDLPLTSGAGKPNLNGTAKAINAKLRELQEENFVAAPTPVTTGLEVALEVVKRVIAVRIEERDRKAAAADRSERRRKLIEALSAKEEAELSTKSKEDLLKELNALDAA